MKYRKKIRLYLVFSIILITANARGQVNESINFSDIVETVKLNTDRDLYISGDELYFTADYFINNKKRHDTFFSLLSKRGEKPLNVKIEYFENEFIAQFH